MKLSEAIKPISYVRAHTTDLVDDVVKGQKTVVVTQKGVARVILQDIRVYERTQETLALLKMLAQSQQAVRAGKTKPLARSFDDLRRRSEEEFGS